MTKRTTPRQLLAAALLLLPYKAEHAADFYICHTADGKKYFTDTTCPDGAANTATLDKDTYADSVNTGSGLDSGTQLLDERKRIRQKDRAEAARFEKHAKKVKQNEQRCRDYERRTHELATDKNWSRYTKTIHNLEKKMNSMGCR